MSGTPPGGFKRSASEVESLTKRIRDLERRVLNVEQGTAVIPILNEDPDLDSPISLWLLSDGRLRGRVQPTPGGTKYTYEWERMSTAGSGESGAMAAFQGAQPFTRRGLFGPLWTRTYRVDTGATDARNPTHVVWGYDESLPAQLVAVMALKTSGVGADNIRQVLLDGERAVDATLNLTVGALAYPDGVPLHIGTHTDASGSAPAMVPTLGPVVAQTTVYPGQTKDIPIPVSVMAGIRAGTIKGFTFVGPTADPRGLGWAWGKSGLVEPTLTLTYITTNNH